VLTKLLLCPDVAQPSGMPTLLGFAFDLDQKLNRAELMTSYCGVNLNDAWIPYMNKESLTKTLKYRQTVINMGKQIIMSLK
jgi:serine/threonine protein kinase